MEFDRPADVLSRFLDCSGPAASALASAMRLRDYSQRDFIAHQGDGNRLVSLILEGIVQFQAVSAEGQTTAISSFGPGDLIGGTGDLEENAYDTLALSRVVVLQIDGLQLRDLMREWPELGVGLSRIYSGQLDAVLDRLAVRVTLSATGRFYRELLRLAGSGDRITPPPVIAALALSAQTTRETGSRATSMLERRGIIVRDQNSFTIVSRRMLEELVV